MLISNNQIILVKLSENNQNVVKKTGGLYVGHFVIVRKHRHCKLVNMRSRSYCRLKRDFRSQLRMVRYIESCRLFGPGGLDFRDRHSHLLQKLDWPQRTTILQSKGQIKHFPTEQIVTSINKLDFPWHNVSQSPGTR